jgi:hypothetical protein
MDTIVSRLDITAIFCDVDDFCRRCETHSRTTTLTTPTHYQSRRSMPLTGKSKL